MKLKDAKPGERVEIKKKWRNYEAYVPDNWPRTVIGSDGPYIRAEAPDGSRSLFVPMLLRRVRPAAPVEAVAVVEEAAEGTYWRWDGVTPDHILRVKGGKVERLSETGEWIAQIGYLTPPCDAVAYAPRPLEWLTNGKETRQIERIENGMIYFAEPPDERRYTISIRVGYYVPRVWHPTAPPAPVAAAPDVPYAGRGEPEAGSLWRLTAEGWGEFYEAGSIWRCEGASASGATFHRVDRKKNGQPIVFGDLPHSNRWQCFEPAPGVPTAEPAVNEIRAAWEVASGIEGRARWAMLHAVPLMDALAAAEQRADRAEARVKELEAAVDEALTHGPNAGTRWCLISHILKKARLSPATPAPAPPESAGEYREGQVLLHSEHGLVRYASDSGSRGSEHHCFVFSTRGGATYRAAIADLRPIPAHTGAVVLASIATELDYYVVDSIDTDGTILCDGDYRFAPGNFTVMLPRPKRDDETAADYLSSIGGDRG